MPPLPTLLPIIVACTLSYSLPPALCPQQASTAVWVLVVWLEGRRDHTQGGVVAVNVNDTCSPDPWCCSLSSPALFLVCIYVAPVMHIYTGIKYIALYNIIYVCGIQGITSNEG